MLRKITPFKFVLVLALALTSCHGSQDVVSESWLQKRKHRPGFHLNIAQLKRNHSKPSISVQAEHATPAKLPRRTRCLVMEPTRTRDSIRSTTWMIAERGEKNQLQVEQHRKHRKKTETPSLQTTATERTEELRTIKREKYDNMLSIFNSALIVASSLAVIIFHILSAGADPALAFFTMVAGVSLPIGTVMLVFFIIERFFLNRDRIVLNEPRKTRWKWVVRIFRWIATLLGVAFVTNINFLGLSLLFFPHLVNVSFTISNTLNLLTLLICFVGSILALPVFHRIDEVSSDLGKMVVIAGIVVGITSTIILIALFVPIFTAFF